VAALYEQSLRDHIDHRSWNAWIHAQLTSSAPPPQQQQQQPISRRW
jgi:hypothetical protein